MGLDQLADYWSQDFSNGPDQSEPFCTYERSE